ncbi:DUF2461 family protein [Leucobacter sp. wl10]|uniref:DUF2461 family protein n=1 Tax=Leucobacter sp. wl10 TaxID=2304677 RepID=UPI0013C33865|nr:DUF2461 family protein [Leucobacter sp. wl10]
MNDAVGSPEFAGFPPELFVFFEELRRDLASRSLTLGPGAEQPLRTVPRGYPQEHPRAEVLRWKGAAVVQEYDRAPWMHAPEALDRIRSVWRGADALRAWLEARVGASTTPAS